MGVLGWMCKYSPVLFEQWCSSFVLQAGRDTVTVASLHEVVGVHKIKTVSTYFLTHGKVYADRCVGIHDNDSTEGE